LIPKKKGADNIKQFRPICLLNVFFKIFPKALSSRFDLVINKIILPCKNDFIKTRDIMDGVFSLYAIFHESNHKKQQGVAFKIDFEKAYDKVCWYLFYLYVYGNVVLTPRGVHGSNLWL
jgi:hypothetical protein